MGLLIFLVSYKTIRVPSIIRIYDSSTFCRAPWNRICWVNENVTDSLGEGVQENLGIIREDPWIIRISILGLCILGNLKTESCLDIIGLKSKQCIFIPPDVLYCNSISSTADELSPNNGRSRGVNSSR